MDLMRRMSLVLRTSVMPSMMSLTILFLLSCIVSLTGAAPLANRDVFDPPITSPTASTVWNVGATQTVTWDVSNIPSSVTNFNGMVALGFLEDGSDSENLMLNPPLAQGFNITDGKVNIVVPSVPTGNNYIVVVFGDSGNASPKFTINNGATVSSKGTAPTETATTPTSSRSVTTTPDTVTHTGASSSSISTSTSTSHLTTSTSSRAGSTALPSTLTATSSTTNGTSSTTSASQSSGTPNGSGSNTNAALPRHNLYALGYLAPLLALLVLF